MTERNIFLHRLINLSSLETHFSSIKLKQLLTEIIKIVTKIEYVIAQENYFSWILIKLSWQDLLTMQYIWQRRTIFHLQDLFFLGTIIYWLNRYRKIGTVFLFSSYKLSTFLTFMYFQFLVLKQSKISLHSSYSLS